MALLLRGEVMSYKRKEQLSDDITLFCGDCLEVMPTLGKVDAVLTDPPYGIGENNEKNLARRNAAAPKDYGHYSWDAKPASIEHINAIREISKHQIIFGGNYFDGLPATSCWLVWDKMNTGDFADCELAWTNLRKAVRRIQWRWNGMIRQGNEERFHPTQKPLEVMKWCLGFLPDAQTILDPFMGSGTTGVACVKLGRKFIGIELDEAYFDIACKRIEDALKRPDLFVQAAPPKAKQNAFDYE
jgi:DNA modification methylase